MPELVIIGGGPAGLAAAVAAFDAGIHDLLVVERDEAAGGILQQCIHNGFGLHRFKEELTGPEYAHRYVELARDRRIPMMLNTIVLHMEADKTLTLMNPERGIFRLRPKAVILAMGCRERPRGALNTAGDRPAGIFTAGTAQRLINREGYMPGKRAVILGSGDIGLIMARRMTLEGAKVECVAELMPYSGGLKRNIVQCLQDFAIPLYFSTTVSRILGSRRVEGVVLQKVDEKRKLVPGTEKEVPCDTLLLSVGLIPENELSREAGVAIDARTKGPRVSDSLETSLEGVFACGNVLHVHDLVDYVSEEAGQAGLHAARYIQGKGGKAPEDLLEVEAGEGIAYTVPQAVAPLHMDEEISLRFRVRNVYTGKTIALYQGDHCLYRRKKRALAPGEMETLSIKKNDLAPEGGKFLLRLEEGEEAKLGE